MENLTTSPTTAQRLGAEALGTFWLVLGGCGTAVLAGDQVGYVGVALAFVNATEPSVISHMADVGDVLHHRGGAVSQ